jgi:hypothetical protein
MAADAKTDLRTVAFRGFPLAIFMQSRQHTEALLREFAFVVDGGGDNTELPRQLLQIVERVRASAAGLNTGAQRNIEEALQRGHETVDFELLVPARLAAGAREFDALLDQVDDYCRAGDLLSLASSQELRRFRQWYLSEIAGQIEGRAPTMWRDFAQCAD